VTGAADHEREGRPARRRLSRPAAQADDRLTPENPLGLGKALREELGSVRLTDLTAADVQKALASIASRMSTRTVQIAHNVPVWAIRQAERDDLVGGTSLRWSSRRRDRVLGGRRNR